MNKKKVLIKNCVLYNSLSAGAVDLLIEDGKIFRIEKNITPPENIDLLDAQNRIAAPGFIDIHIQGAGGADILDGAEESIQTIAKTLARLGTTSFLGTTVVKPETENAHIKEIGKFVNKQLNGASLLGFHLEGPFINIQKKGGLDPAGIYPYTEKALQKIFDDTGDSLKMMTIAPELSGCIEAIKKLNSKEVIPAFGHSNADYYETKRGFDAGINHVTHIFNAMPPIHHREPGPLGAIFENNKVSAQIISDGHHIHPNIVNMIYKLLGGERCICITDGVQAMGLPEGKYFYNGKEYESKNGAAKYIDGTLIGSTMSLGDIAHKFMEFTGCSFETAINTITINPARLLNIDDRKGSIQKGRDADLVLLDNDLSVYSTLVNGVVVYKR